MGKVQAGEPVVELADQYGISAKTMDGSGRIRARSRFPSWNTTNSQRKNEELKRLIGAQDNRNLDLADVVVEDVAGVPSIILVFFVYFFVTDPL